MSTFKGGFLPRWSSSAVHYTTRCFSISTMYRTSFNLCNFRVSVMLNLSRLYICPNTTSLVCLYLSTVLTSEIRIRDNASKPIITNWRYYRFINTVECILDINSCVQPNSYYLIKGFLVFKGLLNSTNRLSFFFFTQLKMQQYYILAEEMFSLKFLQ